MVDIKLPASKNKYCWIRFDFDGPTFRCFRCSSSYAPKMPCSIAMMASMTESFKNEHKRCKEKLESR